jgi:glycerol-3-phosphate dehydrogenase
MPRFGRAARIAGFTLYTGAAGVTGAVIYHNFRPRQILGSEPAAVHHNEYGAGGNFEPPRFPDVRPRADHVAELKRSGEDARHRFDMLVIGGGATGAGVTLDAASRGLRVAVVEMDDFAAGTSSKSTKLVHGGVRYLEKAVLEFDKAQFDLVVEALRERKYFLQTAPHLSSWLPIMVPVDSWWKLPYYWLGTKMYDLLAGHDGIESSYLLAKSRAVGLFPTVRQEGLVGASVYYDGTHNDSRMNVLLAKTAEMYGATVVNHVEVTALRKDEHGRLCGATLRDLLPARDGRPAEEFEVGARCVVNATGPLTDGVRKLDDPTCQDIVAPASGVHVVLPGYFSPAKMGLIDPRTSDGRVMFFLPWQGNTLAGTTDSPSTISRNPVPAEEDIQWILGEVKRHLSPDINVRRSDVLAAWSGIRPLVKDPKAKNTQSVVRNHLVDVSPSGLLTCAGGKWTTYRQMAEDCVDAAIAEFGLKPGPLAHRPSVSGVEAADDDAELDGTCRTTHLKLVGAHGFSKTLFIPLIQHYGLDTDVAKHLAESYGDRAWTVAGLCRSNGGKTGGNGVRLSQRYSFVDGEVVYAVRHEYALTAADVLARRTRLSFLDVRVALEALPRVIDIMADELGWDRRRKDLEWKESKHPAPSQAEALY